MSLRPFTPDEQATLLSRLADLEQENAQLRLECQQLRSVSPSRQTTAVADISSQLSQAEHELAERNRDLQSILDNMPAMIGYWDRQLINRFGNYAYSFWFGMAPSSLPGRHIREVIGEERYRLNLPYMEKALAGEAQTFEREITLPSGEVRQSLANYIPDIVDGEVQGFYVLVADITTLKAAETSLRTSEERYRAVVEDQTEAISRFRPDGSLIFINDVYCRIFGKPREELLSSSWRPVAHPDDLPHIQAELSKLSVEQPVVNIENRVYRGDGRMFWMHFVNRGLFDAQGQLLEIQSVGRDITLRKKIEQDLYEAREQLEQRVIERTEQVRQLAVQLTLVEEQERQSIARDLHDNLGQILHVIKLKLSILQRDEKSTCNPLVGDIDMLLKEASQQVRALTSQLSPPALTNLGLAAALRWLSQDLAQRYPLTIHCALDEQPLALPMASKAILFRAARELLINVARHAKTNEASLTLHRDQGHLVMGVADNGIGFANASLKPGHSGFGLTSVEERISFLGGSCHITPGLAGGVHINLRIPLPPGELSSKGSA